MLFYIYPIVPHAPAFLHSFLFSVTVAKDKDQKRNTHFYSVVLEFFLCYSISIPYAPAFLHSSCFLHCYNLSSIELLCILNFEYLNILAEFNIYKHLTDTKSGVLVWTEGTNVYKRKYISLE